jgi:V8-like Glu-specific endopeptidase
MASGYSSTGSIDSFNDDYLQYLFATEIGMSGAPITLNNQYCVGIHIGKTGTKNVGINLN